MEEKEAMFLLVKMGKRGKTAMTYKTIQTINKLATVL